MSITVPFLDLKAQYGTIRDEVDRAISQVIESSAFAGGPFVEKFEEEFAAYCHTKYAIGVGSGTEALWLALMALGVGKGDEVITVSNTFIATAEAISYTGAKPVFVDIDEKTYTMNSTLLRGAITARTKAIIPVHLYGQMAEMDAIMEIAHLYNLFVLEDACQAHGAEYKGRRAGTVGDAGCFSFYPGKNLGAYGEAGAVVTNDPSIARSVSMLRDHGQARKYHHDLLGWNCRMDGLQAAILSAKLEHLEEWNETRRAYSSSYSHALQGVQALTLPLEAQSRRHVYHLYVVRVPKRDTVMSRLRERGIACGIHYPLPIHLQPAYHHINMNEGSMPVSESVAGELLSLPMYPELTADQLRLVTQVLVEILSELDANVDHVDHASSSQNLARTNRQ